MKKITVLFAIGLLSLSTIVKAGVLDYVITEDGITYYEKIQQGLNNSIVCSDGNEEVIFQSDLVKAYRRDGRVYEKMPVVVNNKLTGTEEFMELVAYRNGMKLFRHNVSKSRGNQQGEELLVYRDGNFVVRLNDENSGTLKDFFQRSGHMLSVN